MDEDRRLDSHALDGVLDALLTEHPDAHVVGLDDAGLAVPLPDSARSLGRPVAPSYASALAMTAPGDLTTVIRTWERARAVGTASTSVHLLVDPDNAVELHFVDCRHRFGSYLGVIVGHAGGLVAAPPLEPSAFRPRVCLARKDGTGVVRDIDEAASAILGWAPSDLVGRRSVDFIHPADHQRALGSWLDVVDRPGARRRVRLRHRHADGSWVWVEVTDHNLLADPDVGAVLTEMLDISEEIAAEDALRASEQLLRRLTEALPLGVLQIDAERRIVYRNALLDRIIPRRRATTADELFAGVLAEERSALEQLLTTALQTGGDGDLEVTVRSARYGVRRCHVRLRPLTGPYGEVTGALLCVSDVTDEVRLRDEMVYRATYDALTQCLNRSSILAALEAALSPDLPAGDGVAALYLDLDHFKAVNDQLGHAAGDQLLVQVARRLRTAGRDTDVVGRLGGDEFLVVCRHVDSAETAMRIAERLRTAMDAPVDLGGQQVTPGISIGVAWSPGACPADALVRRADEAMYRSKRAHDGRPVLAADPVDRALRTDRISATGS